MDNKGLEDVQLKVALKPAHCYGRVIADDLVTRTEERRMGARISTTWLFGPESYAEKSRYLARTWQHTMVSASHWVGFTLPGMMLEPGSFAGSLQQRWGGNLTAWAC